MKKIFLSSFLLIFFISYLSTHAQNCGIERWKIKTLSDADTSFIDFTNIKKNTVHEQVSLTRSVGKLNTRRPSEEEVYLIECFVIGFVKEKDHDIHIEVKDVNTAETMVIELVNPDCLDAKNTSRYQQLKEVYEAFINKMGRPPSTFKYLTNPVLITITGVGFWDFLHGQKGMARNGREIHPVLSLTFSNSLSAIRSDVNITKRPNLDNNKIKKVSGVKIGCICNDGTISNSTGSGACSHHGGVRNWLYK